METVHYCELMSIFDEIQLKLLRAEEIADDFSEAGDITTSIEITKLRKDIDNIKDLLIEFF